MLLCGLRLRHRLANIVHIPWFQVDDLSADLSVVRRGALMAGVWLGSGQRWSLWRVTDWTYRYIMPRRVLPERGGVGALWHYRG